MLALGQALIDGDEMKSLQFCKLAIAVAAVSAFSVGTAQAQSQPCDPSFADNGQSPSFGDLTGVTVTDCAGFYGGNALNAGNPTATLLVNDILAGWGLGPVSSWIEKYDTSDELINFDTMLYGDTVVAFHWGNFPGGDAGNVSAMYRFDAGTDGVDSFRIAAGSQGLSNAAVFVTSPIPEPSTYALMLAGLGLVGFMARRRRSAT